MERGGVIRTQNSSFSHHIFLFWGFKSGFFKFGFGYICVFFTHEGHASKKKKKGSVQKNSESKSKTKRKKSPENGEGEASESVGKQVKATVKEIF